ncbi:MAG: di-heme oxidoredictase family protein [Niabella sp.]
MKIKSTYKAIAGIILVMGVTQYSCSKFDGRENDNPDSEWLSGGTQTAFDESSGAYGHAFTGMPDYLKRVHEIGDGQFNAIFVSAPAPLNPGKGPIFNNLSCASCHIADGRGKVPGAKDSSISILFRVSIPGMGANGGVNPVPGFGDQLQNKSLFGVAKEADVLINYTEKTFYFDDGTPYTLRYPAYTITNTYIPLPQNVMLSPRVASPVFGTGLLEAISESDILSRADPDDKDGDSISGRPNYVWNQLLQKSTLGRFGWKANQPTLLQQTAMAYNQDIGITNSVFPTESSYGQPQYDNRNDDPELSDSLLYSTEFYVRTLQVPVRRNVKNSDVQQGKALFVELGCSKCHIPDQRTAVNVAFPMISNQFIHPYTDLLLHDLGDELADNRPDFLANGNEWRTAPLWGIGLTQRVNGHTNFLHDGRARSLIEAIMWHGGEAESVKNKVKALDKTKRDALIAFLNSL